MVRAATSNASLKYSVWLRVGHAYGNELLVSPETRENKIESSDELCCLDNGTDNDVGDVDDASPVSSPVPSLELDPGPNFDFDTSSGSGSGPNDVAKRGVSVCDAIGQWDSAFVVVVIVDVLARLGTVVDVVPIFDSTVGTV